MLKKFVISLFCLIIIGCKASINYDINKLAEEIVKTLKIEDKVVELDKGQIETLLYLEENSIEEGVFYLSSINTSDMVLIVESDHIDEVKKSVVEYIDNLIGQNTNYFPSEVKKLENAYLTVKGNYLFLIVSEDNSDVKTIIEGLK